MADTLSRLTALAVALFRRDQLQPQPPFQPQLGDAVLDAIHEESMRYWLDFGLVNGAAADLLKNADAAEVLRPGGADAAMIYIGGSGARMDAASMLIGMLMSARLQMSCLRLGEGETTFVRTVLDNFEEMRRAVRGEKIRVHRVTGLAGITLGQDTRVTTPWGTVNPVPDISPERFIYLGTHRTTCTLTETALCPVRIYPEGHASPEFDTEERWSSQAHLLFPLACALSSENTESPIAPLETWSTDIPPVLMGVVIGGRLMPPTIRQAQSIDKIRLAIEEWSRILATRHAPSVDVAARRVVSAIAHRLDRSDALIDAVMAWENLVGTSSEVTYRVTATLAKLLERSVTERKNCRKALAKIYDTRSKIVHGAHVEQKEVVGAATAAIDVAIRALREFYRRENSWLTLTSSERSDHILLAD